MTDYQNAYQESITQVQDKMAYFEKLATGFTTEVSEVLAQLTDIQVDTVAEPQDLPTPSSSNFTAMPSITIPDLNANLPTAPTISVDIQAPTDMVAPTFNGLNIDIPDAPILSNDLSTPAFLDVSQIPDIDTTINLPTLPAFAASNIDTGNLPDKVNLDSLLTSLDLSDLDIPDAPASPILNLPTVPSLTQFDAPDRPVVNDDVVIPDAPTLVLPDMDVLEKINLPDFQYEEVPIFDGIAPVFNVTMPDNLAVILADTKSIVSQDYYKANVDSAIKPLVLEIRQWLDGSHVGLGLPQAVEDALFNLYLS